MEELVGLCDRILIMVQGEIRSHRRASRTSTATRCCGRPWGHIVCNEYCTAEDRGSPCFAAHRGCCTSWSWLSSRGLSPKFLAAGNFVNVLVQSAPIAIVAVGMTFVLLTAGIDLSVGSVVFLAGAVGGSLVVRAGWPVGAVLPVMAVVGLACGVVNGLLVARLRLSPFIVTLAMLFVARTGIVDYGNARDQSARHIPAARCGPVAVDSVTRLDAGCHGGRSSIHA